MSLPYTPELRDEMIQEALKALLKENYCASYNRTWEYLWTGPAQMFN